MQKGVSVVAATFSVSGSSRGPLPRAWPIARSRITSPWRRTQTWIAGWTPLRYQSQAAFQIASTWSRCTPAASGLASAATVVTESRSFGIRTRRSGSGTNGRRGTEGIIGRGRRRGEPGCASFRRDPMRDDGSHPRPAR